jgi:hypothetical protein
MTLRDHKLQKILDGMTDEQKARVAPYVLRIAFSALLILIIFTVVYEAAR